MLPSLLSKIVSFCLLFNLLESTLASNLQDVLSQVETLKSHNTGNFVVFHVIDVLILRLKLRLEGLEADLKQGLKGLSHNSKVVLRVLHLDVADSGPELKSLASDSRVSFHFDQVEGEFSNLLQVVSNVGVDQSSDIVENAHNTGKNSLIVDREAGYQLRQDEISLFLILEVLLGHQLGSAEAFQSSLGCFQVLLVDVVKQAAHDYILCLIVVVGGKVLASVR